MDMTQTEVRNDAGTAIELQDVKVCRGGNVRLHTPFLSVARGELILLTGGNGSGKTTLLKVISGLLKPDHGEVHLNGYAVAALTEPKRDTLRGNAIGFIFQNLHLIPYLTAMENILLPISLSDERKARVTQLHVPPEYEAYRLLAALGVEDMDLLKKPAGELSRGIQQRVAIARAMIGSPPIIIADEATASIDASMQNQVLQIIKELAHSQQTTLIWVTHNIVDEQLFDRHLRMEELNRVCQEGRV